jgi:hypothetical protein
MVSADLLRGRYRESFGNPKAIPADQKQVYRFAKIFDTGSNASFVDLPVVRAAGAGTEKRISAGAGTC